MEHSIAAAVTAGLRDLPAPGAERSLRLQRLTTLYAAAEAGNALRASAVRARETHDSLADVMAACATLWPQLGGPSPAGDSAARAALTRAIVSAGFQPALAKWVTELREIANRHPETGACTVATALQLWTWSLDHVLRSFDVVEREVALAELAESLCHLLAAHAHVRSVANEPRPAFFADLCHVQTADAAGQVATLCAEIVFGHRSHPAWDGEGCAACYQGQDLEALEGLVPGIASSARAYTDVVEADGSHPLKAGPCATREGLDGFVRLRAKLDGCLTGARLARRRAADALPSLCVEA